MTLYLHSLGGNVYLETHTTIGCNIRYMIMTIQAQSQCAPGLVIEIFCTLETPKLEPLELSYCKLFKYQFWKNSLNKWVFILEKTQISIKKQFKCHIFWPCFIIKAFDILFIEPHLKLWKKIIDILHFTASIFDVNNFWLKNENNALIHMTNTKKIQNEHCGVSLH